ncbi:MAG: two-component system response regulator [Flavobacteriales bacterium CG_4_10_14_0_2_um_filter_32_8]|nr:MAG: two-component system response regulator [Flavobacteriales bacterium CG_4_10_14_0_2_um_filter_32_8]PJB15686.1 MAG: two-component system response regulator [Flavobacteriales bacterium CG_4_9_14_3_um_filter_32_8]
MSEKKLAKINVLYIDDEVNNLEAFKSSFRRFYKIFIASSAVEGRKILEENEIEVILTDQRMPEITGVEFLESIIVKYPNPMRILVTGYTDIEAVIDAVNKGNIFKYVSKPWNTDDLKKIIDTASEIYRLRKRKDKLTSDLLLVNSQIEFMLRQKLIS